MLFRFGLFYLVFSAVLVADVIQGRDERLMMVAIGLMILAAVGVATSLASETFIQEKERRTMEALLLIPTSASSIARIKSSFVIVAALTGIGVTFLTGPCAVALVGNVDQYQHFFNQTTYACAMVVCPPASITVAALATIISVRSRSYQAANTAAPLVGILMILPMLTLAYLLSQASLLTTVLVGATWWCLAVGAWRLAMSTVRPETMIRTRGK